MWLGIAIGAAVLGTLFAASAAGSRTDTGDSYTRCCFLVVAHGEGTITENYRARMNPDGTRNSFDLDGAIVHTFKWTSRDIAEYNEENDKKETPYFNAQTQSFKTMWEERFIGAVCEWPPPDASGHQTCAPLPCDKTDSSQGHWSVGESVGNVQLGRYKDGQVKMQLSGGFGGPVEVQGACSSDFAQWPAGYYLTTSEAFAPPSRATFRNNNTSFSVSHPETADSSSGDYGAGQFHAKYTFSATFTYFKPSKLKKQLKALAALN